MRENITGGTQTEKDMSIPILYIIGNSIEIPKNWEDKITSTDEQGRPTGIICDGTIYKDIAKITYW